MSLTDFDVQACVRASLRRRRRLLEDAHTDVGRVLNGAADGVAGLVVEKLGDVLVAQLHEGRLRVSQDTAREVCALLAEDLSCRAVYQKVFPRDRAGGQRSFAELHTSAVPWIGESMPAEHLVSEHGQRFIVRAYDGYATGVFLDHRTQRQRVRELAAGREVLNTFAYTCGFTVAAGLGGARGTVSVDLSRKYLEWGKRNLEANGFGLEGHRFICTDVFEYYKRAARQGHRFGLVILDPPTFSRHRRGKKTFSVSRDLPRLVRGAVELLDAGGWLLLSVNYRDLGQQQLRRIVEESAMRLKRGCNRLTAMSLPLDFRGDPDLAKSVLARID